MIERCRYHVRESIKSDIVCADSIADPKLRM
jgi:hypothetical protein